MKPVEPFDSVSLDTRRGCAKAWPDAAFSFYSGTFPPFLFKISAKSQKRVTGQSPVFFELFCPFCFSHADTPRTVRAGRTTSRECFSANRL